MTVDLDLNILPEPMLLASAGGHIRAANAAAGRLLNRKVAELAKISLTDITADPPETVRQTLLRFAGSGQFIPAVLTLKTSPTQTAALRVEGARLQRQQEVELILRLHSPDDTALRFGSSHEGASLIDQEAFDQEAFSGLQGLQASTLLSAIVNSSDDAIVSKNLNGVITSWNAAAERMFGYEAREAVGRYIADLIIPPDRQSEEPQILDRLRRGERVDHFDTIRMRKDRSRLNVSLTISPVRGADGRVIGASKIARDVTRRVQNEKALLEANEALRRANADLQQAAYSASHDLQEPLRMVATYSELLKRRFGGKLGE